MKIRTCTLCAIILLCGSPSQAATETMIWTNTNNSGYKMVAKNYRGDKKHIILFKTSNKKYQLAPLQSEDIQNQHDTRYQITYQNIPVWGHQLIVHTGTKGNYFITGVDVHGIEQDITDLQGKFSELEIEKKITSTISDKIVFKNINKIIYLDENKKARLAYELALYLNSPTAFISSPHYIIDANTAEVLTQWDDQPRERIGQGLGGNVFILPYRAGLFQHGTSQKDIPSLGPFDVEHIKGKCFVKNNKMRVINVAQTDLGKNSFPILNIVEKFLSLPTFMYPCSKESQYVNMNDGGTAPVHYSYSPINDTMYFGMATMDMYSKYYGIKDPLGTKDLPLRAYTHVKDLDNAFAVPTVRLAGVTVIHQQIVIGEGGMYLTSPAQGVIAHELSHNFTHLNSALVYMGQSGGINEAFSDMAAIAMQDYVSKDYPWYWDGKDWGLGRESTIAAEPIRYMDNPSKDGRSIEHVKDYYEGINVHYSSGVFNKAFYLLATRPDWGVRKAFQVMVDANTKYWTSVSSFNAAGCGVIQAAKDRGYKANDVRDAFAQVGVDCPIKSLTQT